ALCSGVAASRSIPVRACPASQSRRLMPPPRVWLRGSSSGWRPPWTGNAGPPFFVSLISSPHWWVWNGPQPEGRGHVGPWDRTPTGLGRSLASPQPRYGVLRDGDVFAVAAVGFDPKGAVAVNGNLGRVEVSLVVTVAEANRMAVGHLPLAIPTADRVMRLGR